MTNHNQEQAIMNSETQNNSATRQRFLHTAYILAIVTIVYNLAEGLVSNFSELPGWILPVRWESPGLLFQKEKNLSKKPKARGLTARVIVNRLPKKLLCESPQYVRMKKLQFIFTLPNNFYFCFLVIK